MYYVVLDACLVMYFLCDMIYGHGCGSCVMQELHAIKIFKFPTFDCCMITQYLKWYQSHLSHDLHAKNVDNGKCYDYTS